MNAPTPAPPVDLRRKILDRMDYFYGKMDGSHYWPSSREGDLLRTVHKYLTSTATDKSKKARK